VRVLVVDDHRETRELLTRFIARSGCSVKAVGSRAEAERTLGAADFDVMVLDVMLPDGSGIELCAVLRSRGYNVPILLLTARGDVQDRVNGLNEGADDYLVKPFALAEVIARVRALARRGPIVRDRTAAYGQVCVDLAHRCVTLRGKPVPLTAKEFAIVEVLAAKRGVVARSVLLESIWGEISDAAQSSLDVLIGRIRRKLGASACVLRTVRGLGYTLEAPT
jgi:DNA-binding response OmpR family regulator